MNHVWMASMASGLVCVLGAEGCALDSQGDTSNPTESSKSQEQELHGGYNIGAVYTQTNAPAMNEVAVLARMPDGSLMSAGTVPTGGKGSGDGLGSQGAVFLSEDGNMLFAVNAGSNEVSSFAVSQHGMHLELVSKVSSGGMRPISVASRGSLLYVLNAGGDGNVSGFWIGMDGELSPIAGSSRPLSATNTAPAQVQFNPCGEMLIVTEKATSKIDSWNVKSDGTLTSFSSIASSGRTPFGFDFSPQGALIVSEAAGGSVSSYALDDDDSPPITVLSGSVPDNQSAPCWVKVTRNGRYAYTANAGSASISGYRIRHHGILSLLDSDGRTGETGDGTHPIDMALDRASRYLYVLENTTGAVGGFRIRDNGSLLPIPGASGLPTTVVGLAAR